MLKAGADDCLLVLADGGRRGELGEVVAGGRGVGNDLVRGRRRAPAGIEMPRIAWANVPNACATVVSCAVTQVREPLQADVFDWNDVSAVLSVAYEPSTLIAAVALLTCVCPGVLVEPLITPRTISATMNSAPRARNTPTSALAPPESERHPAHRA